MTDFDLLREAQDRWRDNWGDKPASAMAAVTTLMRAQQILMAQLNEKLEPFELTFARYEVLMLLYLSRNGSLPMGKVGERLQVHATSVTSLIDRLERSLYVNRAPHPTDRRTTLAEITTLGRDVAGEATAILNDDSFGMDVLSGDAQEQLIDLLDRIRVMGGDVVASEVVN